MESSGQLISAQLESASQILPPFMQPEFRYRVYKSQRPKRDANHSTPTSRPTYANMVLSLFFLYLWD
jgi:hypothetical protein